MNPILQSLVDLNEVDHEIVETHRQLERYPKMIAALDEGEKKQQHALDEATRLIEEARADRRHLEKDVLTLRGRIDKYKSQQSAVKTNKEYQAMTTEIERLETEIDEKETVGLEKLEIEETAEAQHAEAETALKDLVARHAPERERIATQIIEKKERLERLASERERRVEKVDEGWLQTYELLHNRFPGTACATVEEGHCSECQWSLVAATVQRVRAAQEIIRCDHCTRILYARAER